MDVMPTIVYVHGVGGAKRRKSWFPLVEQNLAKIGSTVDVSQIRLVEIDYAEIIGRSGRRDRRRRPPASVRAISSDPERFRKNRAELKRRLKSYRTPAMPLGRHMPDSVAHQLGKVIRARSLKDAERYRSRRLQVREEILNQLVSKDVSGEFIVIAHSLGSVVMADLLPHLPADRRVRLLISVGSPLGIEGFWMWTANRLRRSFPYDAVSAWVNIWSVDDPVCGYRGMSKRFSHLVVDVPIRFDAKRLKVPPIHSKKHMKRRALRAHKLPAYAAHPSLAIALDWGLSDPE